MVVNKATYRRMLQMKDIHFFSIFVSFILIKYPRKQGAQKIIFTACHSGKLKLAFTSSGVISTSPKTFLTSRIDFTVLLIRIPQKRSLARREVKNSIHQPDSKIHKPRVIGHYFLCTLLESLFGETAYMRNAPVLGPN